MTLLVRFSWILISLITLPSFAQIETEFLPCDPNALDFSRLTAASQLTSAKVRVERLTFTGKPILSASEQQEIEQSLKQLTYTNDDKGADELRERVRDAWQQHGYFNVQVGKPNVDQRSVTNPENTIAITLRVEAGKQYRLEEIRFEGSSQFSTGELRSMFPIPDGEIFDTAKLRAGMEALREAYGPKGFISFLAIPTNQINEAAGTIALTIELQEGKQFRVRRVRVRGLDPTLALKVVRDSGLEPGSIFAYQKESSLKENKSLASGYADGPDFEHRIDDREGTVDLVIDFHGCRPTTTH